MASAPGTDRKLLNLSGRRIQEDILRIRGRTGRQHLDGIGDPVSIIHIEIRGGYLQPRQLRWVDIEPKAISPGRFRAQ